MRLTSTEKSIVRRKKLDNEGLKEQRGVYVPKSWGKEHTEKIRAHVDKLINRGET